MGKKQKNYIKNGKKGLKNSSFLAPPASRKKIISKVGEGDRNAHIYPCLAVYYYFLLQTLIFVVQSCAIKKKLQIRQMRILQSSNVQQYHARTVVPCTYYDKCCEFYGPLCTSIKAESNITCIIIMHRAKYVFTFFKIIFLSQFFIKGLIH